MVLTISIGVEVKFDGSGFLEIEIPKAYYGKVRKTSGSLCRGVSLQEAGCPTEESLPRMGKSCREAGWLSLRSRKGVATTNTLFHPRCGRSLFPLCPPRPAACAGTSTVRKRMNY